MLMTAADLVAIAVRTEEEGERFYRQAAEAALTAAAPEARRVFSFLADQEAAHQRRFAGMSGGVGPADDAAWEELSAYVQSTVDRAFFTPSDAPILQVPLAATVAERIGAAVAFEQQSLLFYTALRDASHPAARETLDAIIGEERNHVRELSALRDALPA